MVPGEIVPATQRLKLVVVLCNECGMHGRFQLLINGILDPIAQSFEFASVEEMNAQLLRLDYEGIWLRTHARPSALRSIKRHFPKKREDVSASVRGLVDTWNTGVTRAEYMKRTLPEDWTRLYSFITSFPPEKLHDFARNLDTAVKESAIA